MPFKYMVKVSKCFCCIQLPLGALLIAFAELFLSIVYIFVFFKYIVCLGDYCKGIWLQFIFLAPFAWLCLAAVIVIIIYFDKEHSELLTFAVIIHMVLVVVFLVIFIVIFMTDRLFDRLMEGIIFACSSFLSLMLLIYFTVVLNSWHYTL